WKQPWVKDWSCPVAARTTDSLAWPTFRQPMPPAKSIRRLPSTSTSVAPRPSLTKIGVALYGPRATAASRRAMRAREFGPGISVFSAITLMTSRRAPALVAVLGGAGAMGRAVAHQLHRSGRRVLILDRDAAAARRVGATYAAGEARVGAADVRETEGLARLLRGASVLVNFAPYRLNLAVMDAAIVAGCHYVDLGGLFHMTRRQLRRSAEFRRAGLLAVLGMGSAPGLTNLFAAAAADGLR